MSWNLLLADDNVTTKKVFELALLGTDVKIHHARNGEELMKMVEEINPDILVLDTKLPGIPGIELCRDLKQKDPSLQIILLKSPFDETPIGEDVGADEVVEKPFRSLQIRVMIDEMIKRLEEGKTPKKEIFEQESSIEFEEGLEDTLRTKREAHEELTEEELQAKTWESLHPQGEVFEEEDLFPEEEVMEEEIELEEKLEEIEAPPVQEVEKRAQPEPSPAEVQEAAAPPPLREEEIREKVEEMAKRIIEKVAWEVIPPLAEKIIREEIEKLKREIEES